MLWSLVAVSFLLLWKNMKDAIQPPSCVDMLDSSISWRHQFRARPSMFHSTEMYHDEWWGLCRRARQILSGCTRVGFCVISIRGQRKSSARNIFWIFGNSSTASGGDINSKSQENRRNHPPTWRHELGNIFSQFGDSVSVVPLRRSVTFGYDFLVHSWCVGSWFSQQPGGGGLRRRRRGCYKSQEVSLLLCSCHAVQEFIKSHQCLFQ
jgi:hypothetical protein